MPSTWTKVVELLSARALKALRRLHITTPEQLAMLPEDRLSSLRGVGERTLRELLAARRLAGESSSDQPNDLSESFGDGQDCTSDTFDAPLADCIARTLGGRAQRVPPVPGISTVDGLRVLQRIEQDSSIEATTRPGGSQFSSSIVTEWGM